MEAYEVYQLAACGSRIMHTAHRVKTAKESFSRLVRYFTDDSHPELADLVERIRYTNGEESIQLRNGGLVQFSARSRAGARGVADVQLLVFDEAQDLTDEQQEAILYTLAASSTGDRQMVMCGTPPDPSSPGTVFARVRRAALSTDPPAGTCWHEWGVVELPARGASFADLVDDVYAANPSMGLTLDEAWTEREFDQSDLAGFSRERLGWWAPEAGETPPAIPPAVWEAAEIPAIGDGYAGVSAFGVKFSPDGAEYALAGCKMARDRSGCAFELVEVGTTERGTRPLANALADRAGRASVVVVDGMNGASALCDNLGEARVPRGYVVRPRTADVVAASQGLLDAVTDGFARHSAQPALDEAAAAATVRPIGNRGGWGFDGSIAMEACALAVWGARSTRRDPTRRQRIL